MNKPQKPTSQEDIFERSRYLIKTLEDEIKADNNCKALLQQFHLYLLNNKNIDPISAGSMASGADYFLRDFMIDNRRTSIFEISPELVRSFAGNWYIINTIEPNMVELESILTGISHFYRFCAEHNVISSETGEAVHDASAQSEYYQQRIDDFHDISGDGFIPWDIACPLPK